MKQLEDWPYSNYMEWVGLRNGTLVDHNFIRDMFESREQYIHFVQDYLLTRQLPDVLDYLD